MCRDGRDARRCARRHRRPAAPATPADAAINTGTPRWGSGEASVAGGGGGDKRTRPPSRVASHQEGVPPMPLLPATPAAMDEGAAAAGHGAPAGDPRGTSADCAATYDHRHRRSRRRRRHGRRCRLYRIAIGGSPYTGGPPNVATALPNAPAGARQPADGCPPPYVATRAGEAPKPGAAHCPWRGGKGHPLYFMKAAGGLHRPPRHRRRGGTARCGAPRLPAAVPPSRGVSRPSTVSRRRPRARGATK